VIGQVTTNSWSFGLYSGTWGTYNPVVSFSIASGNATMRLYDPFPFDTADGAVARTIVTGVQNTTFLWVGRLDTSSGEDRLDTWLFTDFSAVTGVMPDLQSAPAPYVVVPGSNVNIYNVIEVIDRVGFSFGAGGAGRSMRFASGPTGSRWYPGRP